MSSDPSTTTAQVPPQVDATLSRLTANKNVKGVMILRRPLGIILRTAGSLFPTSTSTAPPPSTPTSATTTTNSGQVIDDSGEAEETHSTNDKLALSYARLGHNLVESVGGEVEAVDSGDELRFLRIRTRKHEIMVTPDPEFILIVVQDPTS